MKKTLGLFRMPTCVSKQEQKKLELSCYSFVRSYPKPIGII